MNSVFNADEFHDYVENRRWQGIKRIDFGTTNTV
jgi:hypothetical protein